MSTAQTRPPAELFAGETATWTTDLADFPAGDGWAISYLFRGPVDVDLVGVVAGDAFDFDVLTGTFDTAGTYTFVAWATNSGDGEACEVQTGRVTIAADPTAAGDGTDQTTHNQRMLALLEAALEGTATANQRSYTIAGRSIERIPLRELMQLRDQYARRVEADTEAAQAGLTRAPRRVAVRMR